MGFPRGPAGKESACNVGDLDSIPGLERSLGKGKSYWLQYSGLEIHGLYSPWGRKESDTTKPLSLSFIFYPFHKLSPFYKLNYLIYHCYKIFSHMSLPTTLIISSVIKSINLSFILHIFFLVCCFTFSFIHIFWLKEIKSISPFLKGFFLCL